MVLPRTQRGYVERMSESSSRRPSQQDGILGARLYGTAMHHAKWRELTEQETAAAVAALRELAAGRADLLAEQAGLLIGASEGTLHQPLKHSAAQLLIAAGANPAQIPRWIEEGRRRRQGTLRHAITA